MDCKISRRERWYVSHRQILLEIQADQRLFISHVEPAIRPPPDKSESSPGRIFAVAIGLNSVGDAGASTSSPPSSRISNRSPASVIVPARKPSTFQRTLPVLNSMQRRLGPSSWRP